MTSFQIVALFVRIVGLLVLVTGWVEPFASLAWSLDYFGTWKGNAGFLLFALGPKLFLALLFVFFPASVVKTLTPSIKGERAIEDIKASYSDLSALVFVCLGLYFVILSFPVLFVLLVEIVVYGTFDITTLSFFRLYSQPVMQLLLGIMLIFGAKGLMRFVKKLRTVGQ